MCDEIASRYSGRSSRSIYIHLYITQHRQQDVTKHRRLPSIDYPYLTPHNNTDKTTVTTTTQSRHHRRPDPVGRLTPQAYRTTAPLLHFCILRTCCDAEFDSRKPNRIGIIEFLENGQSRAATPRFWRFTSCYTRD